MIRRQGGRGGERAMGRLWKPIHRFESQSLSEEIIRHSCPASHVLTLKYADLQR